MRNQKGVTLTSLSVYVVVSVVVLTSLTFLNINLMSQIAELSQKSELSNQLLKVQSMLITDIKSAREVKQYAKDYLLFDNGVEYKVKYRANENVESGEAGQTYDIYELYRNDILIGYQNIISIQLTNLSFDYQQSHDDYYQQNLERWIVINIVDSNYTGGDFYVRVGKGY